jgi:hypothetical protein
MSTTWDHYEQWRLLLVNDLAEVRDEIMCDGAPPAIGARIWLEQDELDVVNYSGPCRVRKTSATVISQDARILNGHNCFLTLRAKIDSRGFFPRRGREDGRR